MWGYGKLRRLPLALFDAIGKNCSLEGAMAGFTAHSISNMVRPIPPPPTSTCLLLPAAVAPDASRCPQVWSCATLRYADPTFVSALIEAAADRVDEFTPQGLSNTIWGAATLGLRDEGALTGQGGRGGGGGEGVR